MNKFLKLYYLLTAYWPRMLPNSEDEFMQMRDVLIKAYDVPEERTDAWICIAGTISSVPATKLRCSWGRLANAGKRLRVNNIAQAYRQKLIKTLEDELNAAVAKQAALAEALATEVTTG